MPKEITLEMLYSAKETGERIIEKGDWFGDAVAGVLFVQNKMFEKRSDSNASRLIFNTAQRNGFWKDYPEEGGTNQTRAKKRIVYWQSTCQCCGKGTVIPIQGGIFASARSMADVVAAAYWGKDHNIFGKRDKSKPNAAFAVTYFLDSGKALCKECAQRNGEIWRQQYKEFMSLSGEEKAKCIEDYVNKQEEDGVSRYRHQEKGIHHPIIACGHWVTLSGEPGAREVDKLEWTEVVSDDYGKKCTNQIWESKAYRLQQEELLAGLHAAQEEQRRRNENIKKAKGIKARLLIEKEERSNSSVKIENNILECIFANPDDLQIATGLISPEDFSTPQNKAIYEQIMWMSYNRRSVSAPNVVYGLRKIGKLQKAGGEDRVLQLEAIGVENDKKRKTEGHYNSDELLQGCICLKKLQNESGEEDDPTKEYIEKYCLPTDEKPDNEEISYIISATGLDEKRLRNHLKAMPYIDFQKTKYWKAISWRRKRMDGMVCKDCGCDDQTKLRVHHFTYENHGDERHHFDDLITICDECHRFRHSEEANK